MNDWFIQPTGYYIWSNHPFYCALCSTGRDNAPDNIPSVIIFNGTISLSGEYTTLAIHQICLSEQISREKFKIKTNFPDPFSRQRLLKINSYLKTILSQGSNLNPIGKYQIRINYRIETFAIPGGVGIPELLCNSLGFFTNCPLTLNGNRRPLSG